MYQNVPEYIKVYQNISERTRIVLYQNVPE